MTSVLFMGGPLTERGAIGRQGQREGVLEHNDMSDTQGEGTVFLIWHWWHLGWALGGIPSLHSPDASTISFPQSWNIQKCPLGKGAKSRLVTNHCDR